MAEETEQVPAVQIPVVAKSKKGRGPTVARWQIATIVGDGGVLVQQEKYISPEAALKAVETKGIENAKYVVREIIAETKITARLV